MKKIYNSPKLNVETIKIGYVMSNGSPKPTVNEGNGDEGSATYSKGQNGSDYSGSMGSLW